MCENLTNKTDFSYLTSGICLQNKTTLLDKYDEVDASNLRGFEH